jgi:hypothetical protein
MPHLDLGRTASRNLGDCDPATGYGGKVQFSLNVGLVFGTNSDWVIHRWPPAQGTWRFLNDLLLRFSTRQYLLEVRRDEEPSYRGYGPLFAEEANRIGATLGLGTVMAYRRPQHEVLPLARFWPHGVRPPGYYGDDLTAAALDLASGGRGKRQTEAAGPSQCLEELCFFLREAGREADAWELLRKHHQWQVAVAQSGWPVLREAEAGIADVDGTPLGEVTVDPAWLAWQGGMVRRIAEGISRWGVYADLPLLAAALEEAGCADVRILRHLRTPLRHGRRCWVLQRLLEGAGAEDPAGD